MELSQLQKNILNSKASRSVVISAAASGKTALLTEKVRQILRDGVSPKDIAVITFTNMAAEELKERLGNDFKEGLFIGTIHSLANYFLLSSGVETGKILESEEFDKLFDLVEEHSYCIKHLKWVLLDEAQDSDILQFRFLFDMINPDCFFIVGDPKQCQPAGTKILLRGGEEKNIEEIKIGDEIVYYENENGRASGIKNSYNAKHKYVKNICEQEYKDDFLITVDTENGYKSSYTSNHRTFIKMRTDTEYEHCVYLMCDDNNRFRVGKIALRGTKTKNGNPWRTKMTDEGCSKIWLLKVFKTDLEARIEEQFISYTYQIPQTCWQTDKVKWTEEDINYIYSKIDTYENAKKCLMDYQLNIYYPLIDKNIDWSYNQKFASNATSQLYAINIIPEVMDCVVYDRNINNHSNKAYEHITATKTWIDTPIKTYSLEVDGGTYVADNIITHNSIYQWKGGDPKLMAKLAMDDEVELFDMNENYRNGANILAYAKRLIRPTGRIDTSFPMRQINGTVTEAAFSLDFILNKILSTPNYGDWAILSRTNQEISTIANFLKKNNIPCDTFKQGDLTKAELSDKLKSNTVKILTIHSAKGLEWPYVIVTGVRYNSAEERNICYVAATRARDKLFWLNTPRKKYTKTYNW